MQSVDKKLTDTDFIDKQIYTRSLLIAITVQSASNVQMVRIRVHTVNSVHSPPISLRPQSVILS